MADENTTREPADARPFEERVLSILTEMRADFNARLEKLEAKAYDTKPIWEQALAEIVEARLEIVEARKEIELINVRLDRIEGVAYSTRGEFVEMRADFREFRKHFKEPA